MIKRSTTVLAALGLALGLALTSARIEAGWCGGSSAGGGAGRAGGGNVGGPGGSAGRVTTASGKQRAPESAQVFDIDCEDVTHLTESVGIATGASAEEVEAALKRAEVKKPLLVMVCEPFGECELTDLLEEKVLLDEKVALGARAFRCVRMKPEDAEPEKLLAGHGTDAPRLIVLDPIRNNAVVLEGKRELDAKKLYRAMRKVADKFYDAKLNTTVSKSLKILAKVDKLAPEEYRLQQKKERLDEDDDAKAKKLSEELEEIASKKRAFMASEAKLWEMAQREVKGA